MSLREAAEEVGYRPPNRMCKFGQILDGLDDEDREHYQQMLADDAGPVVLTKVFRAHGRKHGYTIGRTVISDHLNGVCACR